MRAGRTYQIKGRIDPGLLQPRPLIFTPRCAAATSSWDVRVSPTFDVLAIIRMPKDRGTGGREG